MSKSRKRLSRKRRRAAAAEPEPRPAGLDASEPPAADPSPADSRAAVALAGPEKEDRPSEPAASEAPPGEPASTRRGFFRQAWLALGGLAVLEYLWVVVNFLRPRPTAEEEAGIVVAGPLQRFEPNTVTAFRRGKFYLSRLEDGAFLALSRKCTHLGCTVPWIDEEGRFICPCHSSEFDARGVVLRPPAPRPLDLYPIRIENGVVTVDASEPLRRTSFDDSQLTRP